MEVTPKYNLFDKVEYKQFVFPRWIQKTGVLVGMQYVSSPWLEDEEGSPVDSKISYGIITEEEAEDVKDSVSRGKKPFGYAMNWVYEENIIKKF